MANGIRNAASIMNQMKYSGIKQKELAGASRQEGYDNKAVSQHDRMVGKQVAGEEARMQNLDKFADDLAMRKDKLSFAKKVHGETSAMAEERLSMQESAFKQKKLFTGIESVIGLASVGTNYWRNVKQKEMDALEKKSYQARIDYYKSYTGVQKTAPRGISHDGAEWAYEYDDESY